MIPAVLYAVPAFLLLIVMEFLHTERVDRMWRPIEWFFNTPSHHRVHHGSNDPYLTATTAAS